MMQRKPSVYFVLRKCICIDCGLWMQMQHATCSKADLPKSVWPATKQVWAAALFSTTQVPNLTPRQISFFTPSRSSGHCSPSVKIYNQDCASLDFECEYGLATVIRSPEIGHDVRIRHPALHTEHPASRYKSRSSSAIDLAFLTRRANIS